MARKQHNTIILILIVVYLLAIVLANISVAMWGLKAATFNAFFLIGLDLVARDKLHDAWGKNRLWYMLLLILSGGALSYALNYQAGLVAIASTAAFLSVGVVEYVSYDLLKRKRFYIKSMASNALGAIVDTLVFSLILFNGVFLSAFVMMTLAKILGSAMWVFILSKATKV